MRLLFHVLTTTRTWLQVALASLDFRPFWERHRAMGPDEWLEKIRPSSQQSAGKSSILAGKFRWPISHYAFQNRSRLLRSSTIDDAKYPHLSLAIEKLGRHKRYVKPDMFYLKFNLTIVEIDFTDETIVYFLETKTYCLSNFTQDAKVSATDCWCELNSNFLRTSTLSKKYWSFLDTMDIEVSCTFLLKVCYLQVLVNRKKSCSNKLIRIQELLSKGRSCSGEVRLSIYFYCTITQMKAGLWILNSR